LAKAAELNGVPGPAHLLEMKEKIDLSAEQIRVIEDIYMKTLSSRPLVLYNHDENFDETKRLISGAPVYSPLVRHNPNATKQ
jgi:hypothetical protein